ncbi:hypothetical protein NQD34_000915, partial [Periophthalmus magnuspinnatus]
TKRTPQTMQSELKSRYFLKYSREITLDPNTAHGLIFLSRNNREATLLRQNQNYSEHLHKFSDFYQVLSSESLTGRCYWEVEWSGYGVAIAVSYKNIKRKGRSDDCVFGHNVNSWVLDCNNINGCSFWFDKSRIRVSGPDGSRIGVYLDHSEGALEFYNIQDKTVRLLHRVKTTFTQTLYAGVWFNWDFKDSVQF